MTRRCAVWILSVLLGTSIAGQQSRAKFDVSSVKVQKAPLQRVDELRGVMFPRAAPGGVFSASHATLVSLITFAFDVQSAQVVGVPDWARRTAFFEITAKAAGDVPSDQLTLMVQSLLEDRFKLVTHREQRDLKFHALVPARGDGRLGPFLQPVAEGCASVPGKQAARAKFPQRAGTGGGGIIGCGNLSELATLLGMAMDSPVSDATDRSGDFVFELVSGPPRPPAADSGETPFTQALQEQLGLKLDSRRGPVDVLVIDSVSPPSEN